MSGKHFDQDGRELPARLQRAVALLRDEPDPGDLWRHRVMRSIQSAGAERQPVPGHARRRWSLHPAAAVAAGLLCALVGGATVTVLLKRGAAEPAGSALTFPAVRFTLQAPGATSVALVGDFNGWNPKALPMRRAADGQTWEIEVPLPPGRYTYSFIVDGALASDPRAPRAANDDFGAPSSVVLVRGS